jgi:hypothetical protein
MMPLASPSWFAADVTFEGADGWYIGSQNGFSLGPYCNEQTAKMQSAEVQQRLARAKDGGDRLRIVRTFLAGQKDRKDPSADQHPVRSGEAIRMWFRSDRCFTVGDHQWYFLTREGIDVGPYDSKFEAETEARRLIRLLKKCDTEEQLRLTIYEFVRRPIGAYKMR